MLSVVQVELGEGLNKTIVRQDGRICAAGCEICLPCRHLPQRGKVLRSGKGWLSLPPRPRLMEICWPRGQMLEIDTRLAAGVAPGLALEEEGNRDGGMEDRDGGG